MELAGRGADRARSLGGSGTASWPAEGSGVDTVGSRTGAGSVGSRTGVGSGANSVGSQTGAGSGVDSVSSRSGVGSGVDSVSSRSGVGSGVDSAFLLLTLHRSVGVGRAEAVEKSLQRGSDWSGTIH